MGSIVCGVEMGTDQTYRQPGVLRVLQSREETRAFYDKIAGVYDLLAEGRRVLKTGGRIVVVGMSRVSPGGLMTELFEWTHQYFPNYLDCRPILVRRALEDAGFSIAGGEVTKVWVNVEIVRGVI
jgi:hypothetical protein